MAHATKARWRSLLIAARPQPPASVIETWLSQSLMAPVRTRRDRPRSFRRSLPDGS
jgi:hypothetical protein